MSGPTAIIDTDLAFWGAIYFLVEESKIWRCHDIKTSEGLGTWIEMHDASSGFTDGTWKTFIRIKCPWNADGIVYTIGIASKTGQTGDNYTAYCVVSTNSGLTWNYYEIGETEISSGGFSYTGYHNNFGDPVEGTTSLYTQSGGGVSFTYTADGSVRWQSTMVEGHFVLDDPDSLPVGEVVTIEFDVIGDWLSIDCDADADRPGQFQDVTHQHGAAGYWDGQHFSGSIDTTWFADGVFHWGYFWGYPGCWSEWGSCNRTQVLCNLVINGVKYGAVASPGFDVASSNSQWLYVGLTGPDRIMASEDGGVTWFEFYTEHGANDICVDPQLAGGIYYWATDGNLNLLVKQAIGGDSENPPALTSEGLMIETPCPVPLRLVRHASSGMIVAIASGTTLKRYVNGAEQEIRSGFVSGRGLHIYPSSIVFVGNAQIWSCDDICDPPPAIPTCTPRKGDWATYSGGINIHKM